MSLTYSKTAYSSGNVIYPKRRISILSSTVNPKSVVRGLNARKGDAITYNSHDCTRLGDSASGTFSLDSEGVPTVTGSNGTLGYEWGVYECTINYRGYDQTIYVHHTADSTIRAGFSLNLDADGWTDITPPSGARLLYVDPAVLNDNLAGPSNNSTDFYVMGTNEPAGGWKTPTSINAYKTMAAAYAAMRDGQADYMLLLDTAVHVPAATISFNGKSGTSASARLTITSYGTAGTARAHINPTHGTTILDIFAESNIAFVDLDIYPTVQDPTHGDFPGWGGATDPATGINAYNGGGLPTGQSGILIENCRVRYARGISFNGQSNWNDIIIRRNSIHHNYSNTDSVSGISVGGRNANEYPDHEFYIAENILHHNGWITQAWNITGTATSGGTINLVHTGAFTGLDLVGVNVYDVTNGGIATITSNTDNSVAFGVTANVDFTGGGDYEIGAGTNAGGTGQGQATIFNHNMYLRNMKNCIVEQNIITQSSSIAIKITSDSNSQAEEEDGTTAMQSFIEQHNICIDNEVGIGGGGNTSFDAAPRFGNLRVCENVLISMGKTDPTNRGGGTAWGSSIADWENGLMSGNITLKSSGPNGPFGYNINGYTQNTVFAKNVAYNIGDGTGAENGCLYWDTAGKGFSNNYILKNDFKEEGSGVLIGEYETAENSNFTWEGNRYDAARAAATAVNVDSTGTTVAALVASTGETGSSTGTINYSDSGGSIENFQVSRGGTATEAAFYTEIIEQDKASWDSTLDAIEIWGYFKEAFTDRPDIKIECKYAKLTNGVVGETIDFDFTNVGIPKGAIFIRPDARNGLGGVYSSGISIGFLDADGNMWCAGNNVDEDQSPNSQDCTAHQNTSYVASFGQRGYWAKADTDWFTNNKVTVKLIDKGSSVSEDFECFCVAFGGDDVAGCKVNYLDDLGTAVQSFALDTGNSPDLMAFSSVLNSALQAINTRYLSDTRMAWGLAINGDNGIEQMGNTFYADSYVAATLDASNVATGIYDDAIIPKITHPTTEDGTVSCDAMTANGAVLSTDASFANELLGWFSADFKIRPRMKMVNTTIAATSDITETGPGMRPGFCWWQVNLGNTGVYNTARAEDHSHGIYVFDGINDYTANYFYGEEGYTPNADGSYSGGSDSGFMLREKLRSGVVDVDGDDAAFTNEGIDITLINQSAELIPGRMLAIAGVN